jgi:late competence protein required for DNA uptake (superfamily II DNA/RNA helicase)
MSINFDEARATFGRYFCRRCADKNEWKEACERFSMGIYAGMYCGACWAEDGRNHNRAFDPDDAGESYEELT